jgi:mRNA-degrading endonuclease YafQ of YafQ-DinJ toxin-antitoxin module
MNLKYARQFVAAARRLSLDDKRAVKLALEWFLENPTAPGLANHALRGSLAGKRSISADGDLRIVFTERGGYVDVTLLDVGRHLEVYRP